MLINTLCKTGENGRHGMYASSEDIRSCSEGGVSSGVSGCDGYCHVSTLIYPIGYSDDPRYTSTKVFLHSGMCLS